LVAGVTKAWIIDALRRLEAGAIVLGSKMIFQSAGGVAARLTSSAAGHCRHW